MSREPRRLQLRHECLDLGVLESDQLLQLPDLGLQDLEQKEDFNCSTTETDPSIVHTTPFNRLRGNNELLMVILQAYPSHLVCLFELCDGLSELSAISRPTHLRIQHGKRGERVTNHDQMIK